MRKLILVLLSLVLEFTVHADPAWLQKYGMKLGARNSDLNAYTAIDTAARLYGLDAKRMVRIAFLESRINHKARNLNKNGTTDIGLFQINTVLRENDCVEFNTFNVTGNAMCAAKILATHKKHKATDPQWYGRYHSKTPSKKAEYVHRLAEIERRGY